MLIGDGSIRGELCAIVGCRGTSSNQCPICFVHCCYAHIGEHFHAFSEQELEGQRKRDESLR